MPLAALLAVLRAFQLFADMAPCPGLIKRRTNRTGQESTSQCFNVTMQGPTQYTFQLRHAAAPSTIPLLRDGCDALWRVCGTYLQL